MSMLRAGLVFLSAALTSSACAAPAQDPITPGELVARVDDVGLSVDGAAELLAPFDGFANNVESTRSLAELWVDYTVLAEAMAMDSVLLGVDLSEVRELQENELKVLALRDRVIEVDTLFSEAELRERFEEDDPADRIRARHILIVPPEGATATERDSVRAIADSLRQAILEGADFTEAARLYSVDLTANDGGDLGVFGRGEMMPDFEQAAFALDEGELSEVVETSFGLHIIRVDERFGPTFEDARDRYRSELASRIRSEAEAEYIGDVADDAGLTITDAGPALAAQIVEDPWTALGANVASEPLAQWDGGEFTAGELRSFLIMQPRGNILQMRATGDFPGLIRTFALQELLLAMAEADGIETGTSQWDLSEPVYRQQAGANARTLGLFPVQAEEGASEGEARQLAVRRALAYNLSGEIGLLAIGPLIGPLRAERDIVVDPAQLEAVVQRVEEIRGRDDFEPFRREPSGQQPTIQGGPEPEPEPEAEPAPEPEPAPPAP